MFSNIEYLYEHLPARFRREDKDSFLKRFLQFFGDTLDDYDGIYDSFSENIDPETASETWIKFWLENLFGWSWFSSWFTLEQKRTLYANFARHLARRGTRGGIELWLADFNIHARVHTRPTFIGEAVWGEQIVSVAEPLIIIIEILFVDMPRRAEMSAVGETAWGEAFVGASEPAFTSGELNALLRYVQPHAQEIILIDTKESSYTEHFAGELSFQ